MHTHEFLLIGITVKDWQVKFGDEIKSSNI